MHETFTFLILLALVCLLPLLAAFVLATAALVGVLHVVAWVCGIVQERAGCA